MLKSCRLGYNRRDIIWNCFLSALSCKGKWKSTFQCSDPSPSCRSVHILSDGLSREVFGHCVGAGAAWRCSRGSPWHGPAWGDSTGTRQSHPSTAVEPIFTLPYCFRSGRRVPWLVLLLFVLLLVCLCVMFLLIKDGIFFFFKWRQGSKILLFT